VWSARFAAPDNSETVLAEHDGRLVGFIHVMFDEDPLWGSLVDNLHVVRDQHRSGIGRQLLGRAAAVIGERGASKAMYLWVLEQNTSAQQFYRACGGAHVETAMVPPPGGDPARLNGTPRGFRIAWPNATKVVTTTAL
jgi:GNAT superfamily N-acetyltransferase